MYYRAHFDGRGAVGPRRRHRRRALHLSRPAAAATRPSTTSTATARRRAGQLPADPERGADRHRRRRHRRPLRRLPAARATARRRLRADLREHAAGDARGADVSCGAAPSTCREGTRRADARAPARERPRRRASTRQAGRRRRAARGARHSPLPRATGARITLQPDARRRLPHPRRRRATSTSTSAGAPLISASLQVGRRAPSPTRSAARARPARPLPRLPRQ